MLIHSYINTWNWKNKKLCRNTTPAGRSIFTKFRDFPISTSVDKTEYLYGKMFYISFVIFILSYVNTALNQSAKRIHKCYIIISDV